MSEPLYTQEQLIQVRNENYNAGRADRNREIVQMLLNIQQNWEHRPVLNVKTELYKLIELIEETK